MQLVMLSVATTVTTHHDYRSSETKHHVSLGYIRLRKDQRVVETLHPLSASSQYIIRVTNMSKEIMLFCWVQGDQFNSIFPVNVQPSATIGQLKESIHAKKPSFRDIPADSLNLWKVGELLLHVINAKF
jgi:Crinkler effector protein N-terminal domain